MKNWKKLFTDKLVLLVFFLIAAGFFYRFFLMGQIPIPADTILGMYHPWRDKVWDGFTSGVPFKNFLITDPVRQQYVWRKLAVDELKNGNLPIWNPYNFSGTPLLANFQSAVFYPLNILFFIFSFNLTWGLLVFLQPVLAGFFLYLYLRFLKVSKIGSLLGSLCFSFGGFAIAWFEWNTIVHTVLWIPLILLSIEKIFLGSRKWMPILLLALISSFFAGHMQVFFYIFLITIIYTLIKIIRLKQNRKNTILLFIICVLLFAAVTSVQCLPTLNFISLSNRAYDLGDFTKPGWFIPWQNLIQFLAPDFFGNPVTANYWGVWNYGEFIGYLGIIPLIFALSAVIFRRDKKTLFFSLLALFALVFALPTPLAKLPYILKLPFLSTSQPTRLMSIIDFSLSILAAFGFDWFIRNKNDKKIVSVILPLVLLMGFCWLAVVGNRSLGLGISNDNILVARKNLILPSMILLISGVLIILKTKNINRFGTLFNCLIVSLVVIDLFRFGWKFTPFSPEKWLFPQTKLTGRLTEEAGNWRIMSLDRQIMPPNFASSYRFQDVSGYDPLYLSNYSQLAGAWGRNAPDITPASFNRIITPDTLNNFFPDLMGVKYLLSFQKLAESDFTFLDQEGQTYLYENKKVFPRAFLVEELINTDNKQEEIEKMFALADRLRFTAVTSQKIRVNPNKLNPRESATITQYQPNKIEMRVRSDYERMLVLTDIYYPVWQAYIEGEKTEIYPVDFALRGIIVPPGEHKIIMQTSLL
ncbi:YfhO family protein [Candidatus Microgenomates bacterium]|nr:YfhO family protein [Candidatus Microgenomates bacterium]